jgi:hypothetical protein
MGLKVGRYRDFGQSCPDFGFKQLMARVIQ